MYFPPLFFHAPVIFILSEHTAITYYPLFSFNLHLVLLLHNYMFQAHYQLMCQCSCSHLGYLKRILQKISQDGIVRTIFPEFLQVNNCLCSVTLKVSFVNCIILGLHFLSLNVLNILVSLSKTPLLLKLWYHIFSLVSHSLFSPSCPKVYL